MWSVRGEDTMGSCDGTENARIKNLGVEIAKIISMLAF
jgi:hypothetical protein